MTVERLVEIILEAHTLQELQTALIREKAHDNVKCQEEAVFEHSLAEWDEEYPL